jgi:hypothetical protein
MMRDSLVELSMFTLRTNQADAANVHSHFKLPDVLRLAVRHDKVNRCPTRGGKTLGRLYVEEQAWMPCACTLPAAWTA